MTTTERQLRDQIEHYSRALSAKDLDAVMAHYVDDARTFDLAPPLEHRGDAIRQGLAAWFPTWDGPIGHEMRDLVVTAGDDVGFAHGLAHMTGARTDGTTSDVWFRLTVCFRKVDGAWKVVHEHTSVPFYMDGSVRAAIDLEP